jgi:hypothetical protein
MKKLNKTTIYIHLIILAFVLLFNGCVGDDKFTIKGKLLTSCERPEPASGYQLLLTFNYGVNSKFEQIATTTNTDGSFEFTYEKKFPHGEMFINGRQSNGLGTINYLNGIPVGRNLDIGNLYSGINSCALIKIKTIRQTSQKDTVFYNKVAGQNIFKNYITGPFDDGQILDTLFYRNVQFYDLANYRSYSESSPSGALFPFKLSNQTKIYYAKIVGSQFDIICFKYNIYEVFVE